MQTNKQIYMNKWISVKEHSENSDMATEKSSEINYDALLVIVGFHC